MDLDKKIQSSITVDAIGAAIKSKQSITQLPMEFHISFDSYLKLRAEPTHIVSRDQQKAKALILFQTEFSFSNPAVDTIRKAQHRRLFRGYAIGVA